MAGYCFVAKEQSHKEMIHHYNKIREREGGKKGGRGRDTRGRSSHTFNTFIQMTARGGEKRHLFISERASLLANVVDFPDRDGNLAGVHRSSWAAESGDRFGSREEKKRMGLKREHKTCMTTCTKSKWE